MAMNPMFNSRLLAERADSSELQSEESREEAVVLTKGKYSAETLMTLLDKEKLEALEKEFNDHPDGIELHNFVWLMNCAMAVPEEEKAELVLGLYYLFQEIDINGDEHMEWSEFTQFIIDAVMSQHSKEKNEEKELTATEIMEIAQFHKARRYHLSPVIDRTSHAGVIHSIAYSPSLDLLWTVENSCPVVRFYNTKCEVKVNVAPAFQSGHFVVAACYSEREYTLVVAGSDQNLYVYEREVSGFRLARTFPLDFICLRIWYFERHATWMVASGHHSTRSEVSLNARASLSQTDGGKANRKGLSDNLLRELDVRSGLLRCTYTGHTDNVMDAIEIYNPMCVATAGMDKVVYLWDLTERKKIGVLSGRHHKGVRQIDYCPEYGGNIISVGYEKDIHVWSPEVSLSKCYVGRLEGHNCPVVSCKFFKGRPTCVSVDERGNIRLWDIRQFSCLQIISQDAGRVEVNKVLPIAKHDKFVVVGKRLVWYDPVKDSSFRNLYQDAMPMYADFNHYYLQFVVVTKHDIRIYDAVNGKLKKIYTDVQDSKAEGELSAFTLDHRHRIFFVGDNFGCIRAYNYSNGALMKKVLSASGQVPNPVENSRQPKDDDWSTEISKLYFCEEDKILISSSWDSSLKVYDMQDVNAPNLLRTMNGGHRGSDVTCLTYSSMLSLIASASSNGLVAIWDFESAKLESVCTHHRVEITGIDFLNPYPVLVTASVDHLICLYGVRPCPEDQRYRCFMVIDNFSWGGARDVHAPLTAMLSTNEVIMGIPRHKRKRHVKKGQQKGRKAHEPLEEEEEVPLDNSEWLEELEAEVVADPTDHQLRPRTYLYVGDDKGFIKIWNFDRVFAAQRIEAVTRSERDKPSYNPRRRDERNVENDVKFAMSKAVHNVLPDPTNPEPDILVREWKAHREPVTCVRFIAEPRALLSFSKEYLIKMWSREGELWGEINLRSTNAPRVWNFPYDWEGRRQADVEKVKEILKLLEEKVDFSTQSLSFLPCRPGLQQKKPKAKRAAPPRIVPVAKATPKRESYTYVDDDDPPEEEPKRERKYSGSVLELKKKLDEMDERRAKELSEMWATAQSMKQRVPGQNKPRGKEDEDTLRRQEAKSQKPDKSSTTPLNTKSFLQRTKPIPKSSSKHTLSKQLTKKSTFQPDDMQLFERAMNKVRSVPQLRPAIGVQPGTLTRFHMNLLGEAGGKRKILQLKKKHKINADVKCRPGEGQKLMSRAISTQALLHPAQAPARRSRLVFSQTQARPQ